MRLWLIPSVYAVGSMVVGVSLPRIEHDYLGSFALGLSVTSAQAYLSATASGMMALSGIVFSIAFVMVQFSAIAYSPRLVMWFGRDHVLFHALGVFVATFIFALCTLAWIDREGRGAVPFYSCIIVGVMLMLSMLLFARLVQRLNDLQITNVLHMIGDIGRDVIRETSALLDLRPPIGPGAAESDGVVAHREAVTQILVYKGRPRAVVRFDIATLLRHAIGTDGTIVMTCAVGDTVVEDAVLLRIHGGKTQADLTQLRKAIHLGSERTFEQDPKYAIRLLVDIAIKALSPAINDPTTAVQAIDQIEDLLRRLGRHQLDTGYVTDDHGVDRVVVPMSTWDDYLALAFDEIRQFGVTSIQIMRRLRSALVAVEESLTDADRIKSVRRYRQRLDRTIEHSAFDAEDRAVARRQDRQGLGLTRPDDEPGDGKVEAWTVGIEAG